MLKIQAFMNGRTNVGEGKLFCFVNCLFLNLIDLPEFEAKLNMQMLILSLYEFYEILSVKYTQNVRTDSAGELSFRGFMSKVFIDVCTIEYCEGFFFLKIRGKYYIIESEAINYKFTNF